MAECRGTGSGRKKCRSCSLDMNVRDLHVDCLQCLTTSHCSTECQVCKDFCFAMFSCRLGIVGDALQKNQRWPDNWRSKLLETEDSVWSVHSKT